MNLKDEIDNIKKSIESIKMSIELLNNDINKVENINHEPIITNRMKIIESEYKVIIDRKIVNLTAMEYKLVEYLYKRSPEVCTRSQIIKSVWLHESEYIYDDRVVDVTLHRVRQAFKRITDDEVIRTMVRVGYFLIRI